MNCKDCFYDELCSKKGWHFFESFYMQDLYSIEKVCDNFKNKLNVIPVIRCANCRHRKKGVFRAVDNLVYWQCEKHQVEILLTDFCSYGEKEKKDD